MKFTNSIFCLLTVMLFVSTAGCEPRQPAIPPGPETRAYYPVPTPRPTPSPPVDRGLRNEVSNVKEAFKETGQEIKEGAKKTGEEIKEFFDGDEKGKR